MTDERVLPFPSLIARSIIRFSTPLAAGSPTVARPVSCSGFPIGAKFDEVAGIPFSNSTAYTSLMICFSKQVRLLALHAPPLANPLGPDHI